MLLRCKLFRQMLRHPSLSRLHLCRQYVSIHPSKTSAPTSRNQRGLTLVELMIAMLLGLFLLGGLLQIFISSKQTNRMQEGLSRLQENGRFAMDFMTRDIRLAGFMGCSNRSMIDLLLLPHYQPSLISQLIFYTTSILRFRALKPFQQQHGYPPWSLTSPRHWAARM